MRKIKFRVWNTTEKTWIDTNSVHVYFGQKGDDFFVYGENGVIYTNCVIQEFSGLYDKNGKEIYEDDIIKHNIDEEDFLSNKTVNRKVIFKNGMFGFPCLVFRDNVENLNFYCDIGEIIGNILENPELL